MLVIEIQFPAGRYHATPWGRNVNEGEVEWPPSPYRLARALIDIWKRRRPTWSEERVEVLLNALSGSPKFFLPAATVAHTRSYLSSNKPDPTDKQLILDGFVVLDRTENVLIRLEADLDPNAQDDLNELLMEMNYLGRSESWVEARLKEYPSKPQWNCFPASSNTPNFQGEIIPVACAIPPARYSQLPTQPTKQEWKGKKLVKTKTACSWMEALCISTKRLLEEGWSDPPGLVWEDYFRTTNSFSPQIQSPMTMRSEVRYAKYALVSRVLPLITESASFAEKIRRHLMGIHKRVENGDPSLVSPLFSGKDRDGKPLSGHRHAFYVPLDEDGDGRLDHMLIYGADPFEKNELKVLDSLSSMWQSDGRPNVNIVLTALLPTRPVQKRTRWISATPFVTARHYRKGRGEYCEWMNGEIVRECQNHGLPNPVQIEWIPATQHTSHPYRWIEFIRNRKGKTPLRGHGCILSFAEAVPGPFTLGAVCHYGLGLFIPHK